MVNNMILFSNTILIMLVWKKLSKIIFLNMPPVDSVKSIILKKSPEELKPKSCHLNLVLLVKLKTHKMKFSDN